MKFSDRIKVVRTQNKLKKIEFADRIHVDQSYISRLESGQNKPSDRVIELICREFNVNREWLETGKGPQYVIRGAQSSLIAETQAEYGDPDLREAIEEVIQIFNSCDKEIVEALKINIRALLDLCIAQQSKKNTTEG